MTIIQALERQNRRRESRRLAMSSVLLCLMVVLAFAVSGESKIRTTPDPTVERLQTRTKEQADQLERLRQLFSFCRSSVNWSDDRCGNPTGTSSVGSLPVDTRVVRVNDSSDDGSDDSSDNGRTVVVQPSRPTASPTRGSQRPTHTSPKNNDTGPGNRDRGKDHTTGDRPTKNDRK